ncbi:MAG: MBG domain-containing protein [Clostridia bacterium]
MKRDKTKIGSFAKSSKCGFLLCAILCVLSGSSLFALSFSSGTQTAYAYEVVTYNIFQDGEKVKVVNSATNVVIYNEATFLHSAVKEAIDKDRAGNDYNLSITPPQVSLYSTTGTAAAYDENKNMFNFKVECEHFLKETDLNFSFKWYAKSSSKAEFDSLDYAGDTYNNALFPFGEKMAKGSYDVKAEVTFNFNFDGKSYATAATAIDHCTVTNGEISLSKLPEPTGIYGEAIEKLSIVDELNRGKWIYTGNDKNEVLTVGNYKLKYRLLPNNPNYTEVSNITLDATIKPRTVRVVVENKTSAEGKPLANLTVRLSHSSVLVGADTLDNLKIKLSKQEGQTRGDYKISGEYDNKNYNILFVAESNEDGDFSVGGTYTILPNTVELTVNGSVKIVVFNADGFSATAILTAEPVAGGLPIKEDNLVSFGRFRLAVKDGGTIVQLSGETKIIISEMQFFATNIYYFDAGVWNDINLAKSLVDGKVEFAVSALDEICFAGFDIAPQNENDMWLTIMLSCLFAASVLGVFVTVVAMRKKKKE